MGRRCPKESDRSTWLRKGLGGAFTSDRKQENLENVMFYSVSFIQRHLHKIMLNEIWMGVCSSEGRDGKSTHNSRGGAEALSWNDL